MQSEPSLLEDFLSFFQKNAYGIFSFMMILVIVMLIVQWIMWLTKIGRYKHSETDKPVSSENSILYVVADFFVKVINDFKHLLALIVVLIFAWVLIYSVIYAVEADTAGSGKDFEHLKDVLQAVVASLGGIVGSIIGYYFGESAAKSKATNMDSSVIDDNENIDKEPITPPDLA